MAVAAISRLFPAPTQDEPRVLNSRPRVEKTAARRREGSDVTLPKESDRSWLIKSLIPCDSTTATSSGDSYCQHLDQKVDTLRAPIDTATKRRP